MTDLDNAHVIVGDTFVSQRIVQLVEAIRDYSSELDVEWVPPRARRPGQAAFAIKHTPTNGNPPYVIKYVNSEEEFDERILMAIIQGDQRVNGAKISDFEAWEQAQSRLKKQKKLDEMEEAHDVALHVFKSPLNSYRVNKELLIKEGIPFNAHRSRG